VPVGKGSLFIEREGHEILLHLCAGKKEKLSSSSGGRGKRGREKIVILIGGGVALRQKTAWSIGGIFRRPSL